MVRYEVGVWFVGMLYTRAHVESEDGCMLFGVDFRGGEVMRGCFLGMGGEGRVG